MKKIILLSILSLFTFVNLITAQNNFKTEFQSVLKALDLNVAVSKKEDMVSVLKGRYQKNRAFIMKKYKLSDKEYNTIAQKVHQELKGLNRTNITRFYKSTYEKANENTRLAMDLTKFAVSNDNPSSGNYSAYGISVNDIINATIGGAAGGTAVGTVIGGSLGGPLGAAIGAAEGTVVGAVIGAAAGAGMEAVEEVIGQPILGN